MSENEPLKNTAKNNVDFGKLLYFLLLIPLIAIVVMVVKEAPFSLNESTDDYLTNKDEDLRVFDKWDNGEIKTKVSEWPEGQNSFVKFCHYGLTGELIGCGIEKNGKMWDGVLVEWYRYSRNDPSQAEGYGVAQRIFNYKDGKPDGEWNTFSINGRISSKTVYKEGKRISTEVYNNDGEIIGNMSMKREQSGNIGRQ